MAMSVTVDLLKQDCCTTPATNGNAKERKKGSKMVTAGKTKEEEKRNKWAWKDEALKTNSMKEDGIPVKNMNDKKYFWCPKHNYRCGKWVIHYPHASENARACDDDTPNVNIAMFDTPLTKKAHHPPMNDFWARVKEILLGSGWT